MNGRQAKARRRMEAARVQQQQGEFLAAPQQTVIAVLQSLVERAGATSAIDRHDQAVRLPTEWLDLLGHAVTEARAGLAAGAPPLLLANGQPAGFRIEQLANYRRWLVEIGAVTLRAILEVDTVVEANPPSRG